MEIISLCREASVISNFMAELRNVNVQNRRDVFRTNIESIGIVLGYEISKQLPRQTTDIQTPLGSKSQELINANEVVLITILRAGLPLHNGLLKAFPHAESGFVSAYRKHNEGGSFEIEVGYIACPSLQDKVLILSDPMLATGSSFQVSMEALKPFGTPKEVHFASVIASEEGVNNLKDSHPDCNLWVADIDPELNSAKYIVPGLGDAGDLAFGVKLQS